MSALLSSSGYHLLRPHCLPVTLPPRHSSPFPSRPLLAHHFVWNIISFYPFPLVLCNILRSQPSSLIPPPLSLPPPALAPPLHLLPPRVSLVVDGCWADGRFLPSSCVSPDFIESFTLVPSTTPSPSPFPPLVFLLHSSLWLLSSLSFRCQNVPYRVNGIC